MNENNQNDLDQIIESILSPKNLKEAEQNLIRIAKTSIFYLDNDTLTKVWNGYNRVVRELEKEDKYDEIGKLSEDMGLYKKAVEAYIKAGQFEKAIKIIEREDYPLREKVAVYAKAFNYHNKKAEIYSEKIKEIIAERDRYCNPDNIIHEYSRAKWMHKLEAEKYKQKIEELKK
ncbi:MAG: hypothetical protein QXW00_02630 [Candidatus Woesearchaeota archaeon]